MPTAEADPGLTGDNMGDREPVVKNVFSYTDAVIQALETSLSPERMATYVGRAGGDREKAVRLYTWNTAVSAAFYGPLQGLEVALRNAMHRELSVRYGVDWYDNSAASLDAGTIARVSGRVRICGGTATRTIRRTWWRRFPSASGSRFSVREAVCPATRKPITR